ncbi:MAG TPA: Ig-like domain-containing protein, partial [Cellvibrionaceae bacterium]
MNKSKVFSHHLKLLALFTCAAFITSCGSRDKVLGTLSAPVVPPVIVSTSPTNDLLVVPVHNPTVTATFNQAVAFDDGATFTLTCGAPCTNPTGKVELDSTNHSLSFKPSANLEAHTLYTATVHGARGLGSQIAMNGDYVWHFTTGIAPLALSVNPWTPAVNATGVALNTTEVSAAFSEAIAVAPSANSADATSFALSCAAPCVSPAGTVSWDADHKVVNYKLPAGTTLAPLTQYTATIKGVNSLNTGAALAQPFTWQFTTGNTVDVTRPSVAASLPAATVPGPTLNAPTNMAISATFSEAMNPASIAPASFTLACDAPCVSPVGTTSYSASTRSAIFTPANELAANTTYTATITTAAADLAGNGLANNYAWTFTTGAAVAASEVSVVSTNPISAAVNTCPDATVNALLTVPSGLKINPATINSTTFAVTEAAPVLTPVVASSIGLDSTGKIASFKPKTPLVAGTTYTATLKGGASGIKDFAIPANTLGNDYQWSFTAAACPTPASKAVSLGSAATFGAFGGTAGVTSAGTHTWINGNVGTTAVSTLVTGLHDVGVGCVYTETTLNTGAVNGTIFTAAPSPTVLCPTEGTEQTAAIASAANADALTAYNA